MRVCGERCRLSNMFWKMQNTIYNIFENKIEWVPRVTNDCSGLLQKWNTDLRVKTTKMCVIAWRDEKESHDSSKNQVKEFIFCRSTSRVVESSFRGFPALSAVALVKWQTLLPCASHHLQVAGRIFGLPQVPYTVHSAASGVRYVKNLSDWVHGQVVLMSRAGAYERRRDKVMVSGV